jgi:MFS family permease
MLRNQGYELRMALLMMLLWGFVALNRVGIAYLFPVLVPLFHMAYWQAGLLISGTSVTWAFSSWIGGNLSDRYTRKGVLVPAMSFAAVMAALMGAGWNFISLFVIRDLLGIGDGVGWSVGNSLVEEQSSPERRGLNMGIFSGGYSLVGAGIGAIIITRLSAALGWRWVFPLIGAGTLLITLAVLKFIRETTERQGVTHEVNSRAKASTWEVFKYRPIIFLIAATILILTWVQVSVAFNTLFLTKVRHFTPLEAGSILSGWGILGFIGQITLTALSDRIGRKVTIITASLVSGIGFLLYIFGGYGSTALVILLSISGFFGWGQLSLTTATVVVEAVPKHLHGTAVGVAQFCGVIVGATLMPVVAGVVAGRWGLASSLAIAAVAMLLVAPLMWGIKETSPAVLRRQGLTYEHRLK